MRDRRTHSDYNPLVHLVFTGPEMQTVLLVVCWERLRGAEGTPPSGPGRPMEPVVGRAS